jgi:hypothetical protein
MPTSGVQRAPQSESPTTFERLLQRRATEAVIWGIPVVRFDVMRQAFFRDAGATYGDISYWSKPADWKLQLETPNIRSCYIYFNLNTTNGPVVVDLPVSSETRVEGALHSAWETPLIEIGGSKRGNSTQGGKLLVLPPQYKGLIPSGFTAVRSESFNVRGMFCATSASPSSGRVPDLELVRKMHVYPFAQAFDPPAQRFIDMSGKLFDAVVRFDDTFFESLARMVHEEPVQTRDLVAMNQIYSLGIQKNQSFEPDRATREVLRRTAEEVHAGLVKTQVAGGLLGSSTPWIRSAVYPASRFSYETAVLFGIDERNVRFYMAFKTHEKRQDTPPYLCAFCDAAGNPLLGERNYRLRVPAVVPVKKGWEIAAYDLSTACFIRESPCVAIDSQSTEAGRNTDGSLDVYFGPTPPAGQEKNWIYTAPGQRWFTLFRLYEPASPFFEKRWALPNLERCG